MALSVDDIMRRFCALCPRSPGIQFRPTFKSDDSRRWYVELPRVSWVSEPRDAGGSNLPDFEYSGATPEEALFNMWESMIHYMARHPTGFLLLYTCPDNVSIPGDTPQAWVRWSIAREQWEDVTPTPELLAARNVPNGRIYPYNSWEIRGDR